MCVNPNTNEMWSYDNSKAMDAKVDYACRNQLAGVGVFDLQQLGAGQPNQAQEYDALISELDACVDGWVP